MNYRTGSVPPFRSGVPNNGRIYVSLGTIFNTESGDLLARLTTAVAATESVTSVLVTTGGHVDPGELGPQPDHVSVHRFLPQREVLADCVAVVCHGGSGTVLDALSYGLPMVLLPLGADQPFNASCCRELGCAVVLAADKVTPQQIGQAIDTVLTDPGPRDAARRLQEELGRQPSIERAMGSARTPRQFHIVGDEEFSGLYEPQHWGYFSPAGHYVMKVCR